MEGGSVDEAVKMFGERWRWRSKHASAPEVWLKLGAAILNAPCYSCRSSATSLAGSTARGTITMAVPYSGDDVR